VANDRSELRARLRARIAELEVAMQGLSTDFQKSSTEVRRISQQLRRAGGRYGFPEVTEAAGATELAEESLLPEEAGRLLDVLKTVARASDSDQRVLLIVDDDPVIVRALEAVLAAPDRHILSAGTVAQATALLAAHDVALVVLDLFLPDDDGRHLLSQLQQQSRGAVPPPRVFVLGGRVGPAVKAECHRLGADGYFEKPVDPAVLAIAVRDRLANTDARTTVVTTALAPDPGPALRPSTTRVVLLAEDDPLITSVVQHRLGREGFEVRAFPDGQAALAAADQFQADLALLDGGMPAMDGFELLARLRALPHYRDVPVIMFTSVGAEDQLVRAFDLGANDYVVKPFSPAELVARVRRLVIG
jgi:two-component system phosphate regulon response regulator PhoB